MVLGILLLMFIGWAFYQLGNRFGKHGAWWTVVGILTLWLSNVAVKVLVMTFMYSDLQAYSHSARYATDSWVSLAVSVGVAAALYFILRARWTTQRTDAPGRISLTRIDFTGSTTDQRALSEQTNHL